MEIEVMTPFKDSFHRRNLEKGKKHLRCFPVCCESSHVSFGFCGQPVSLSLSGCEHNASSLRCWAEFLPEAENGRYALGTKVSSNEILSLERSRKQPTLPFIRGSVQTIKREFKEGDQHDGKIEIVINKEKMGWHYSWISHKHSSKLHHVLRIYLFLEQGENKELELIGLFSSPKFQMFCREQTNRKRSIEDISSEEEKPMKRVKDFDEGEIKKDTERLPGNSLRDVVCREDEQLVVSFGRSILSELFSCSEFIKEYKLFSNQATLLPSQKTNQYDLITDFGSRYYSLFLNNKGTESSKVVTALRSLIHSQVSRDYLAALFQKSVISDDNSCSTINRDHEIGTHFLLIWPEFVRWVSVCLKETTKLSSFFTEKVSTIKKDCATEIKLLILGFFKSVVERKKQEIENEGVINHSMLLAIRKNVDNTNVMLMSNPAILQYNNPCMNIAALSYPTYLFR